MKIIQAKAEFKPITIKLETREEAEAFWAAIEFAGSQMLDAKPKQKKILIDISNWFSNHFSS